MSTTLPTTDRPAADARAWREAGRRRLAAALGELAYEGLLAPRTDGDGYVLDLPGEVAYRFAARRGHLGDWRVTPASIVRVFDGRAAAADDPVRFVLDARGVIGLDGPTTAEVVRELTATVAADVWLRRRALAAAELVDLDHVRLEGHQAGHPCMVLNKGRLGFAAADLARYAPESQQPFRLPWLAAKPDLAVLTTVPSLDRDRLLDEELDSATRVAFGARLRAAVPDPDGYVWFPVHPWHLDEVVRTLFAAELADGRLVELGEAPDRYLPLQSIRTLANVDHPHRRNVKLPLLIRNTLVWRGLSAEHTPAAPAVTDWLRRLPGRDPLLAASGFTILGEEAAVVVRHPALAEVADAPYRYHELLGAVWREPVDALLGPDERARTLASLLHVDPWGRALVAELVARSGLAAQDWLARLFGAVLPPLLQHLYAHGVAFCPHGENTVLILDRDEVPRRIAVKDLAEDVNLLPGDHPAHADLPPAAERSLLRWSAPELAHSVLSALVAGHFRVLAGIAEEHLQVPEARFWALVRDAVDAHHAAVPELADAIEAFGILAPRFDRVCLNREQLLGGGFHDRADRDAEFDLVVGQVPNPLVEAAACTGR